MVKGQSNGNFGTAKWLTFEDLLQGDHRACPLFSKTFVVRKTIKKASITVTALGVYEAKINGLRIGREYFSPGFTNYNRALPFRSYDISDELHVGTNHIEVLVGEGWYRGMYRGDKPRDNFGDQPGLMANIVLIYKDGSRQVVPTDESWQMRWSGIGYSELYNGEFFDSTMKSGKTAVKILNRSSSLNLERDAVPGIGRHEVFYPVLKREAQASQLIVDFGQNIAGWVELDVIVEILMNVTTTFRRKLTTHSGGN